MENLFKDCIITSYPFNNTYNLSDNLCDYIWYNLFIDNKIQLDINLLNALTDNIDGDYETMF